MKITKSKLKQIIKEELEKVLEEIAVTVDPRDVKRAAHEEETSRYVGSSSGENRKKAFEIYRKEQLVKDMKSTAVDLGLPIDHPIIKKIINNLNQLEKQLKTDIAAFATGKDPRADPRPGGAGDWQGTTPRIVPEARSFEPQNRED